MLKLISLDDRPTQRARDAEDITLALTQAFDRLEEDLFENSYAILTLYDTTDEYTHQVGSHLIGRQLQILSQSHQGLRHRLTLILQGHLNAGSESLIHQPLTRQHDLTEIQARASL